MKIVYILLSVAAVAALPLRADGPSVAANPIPSNASETYSTIVSATGEITLPDYRGPDWQHLGSWTVANEGTDSGNGMHHVYTTADVIAAFQTTGEWPDGAVIVKEVNATIHQPMTTGDVHWSSELVTWFVMIKDRKTRFDGNPLWGDGWGWARFAPDNPAVQLADTYETDCKGCHLPAADQDWIYAHGYRALQSPSITPAPPSYPEHNKPLSTQR